MRILAVELSSDVRSVAAWDGGASAPVVARESAGRSTAVFELIARVLQGAGWQRDQVETVAVGIGPGSYTGIRVAIALAQGWCLARSVRLVPVRGMDAMAEGARAEGLRGRVYFAVDAQRGEFYLAGYELGASGGLESEPLCLVPAARIDDLLSRAAVVMGPDIRGRFPAVRECFPDAGVLARMARERGDAVAPEHLQPVYLRETAFVKAPPPRRL